MKTITEFNVFQLKNALAKLSELAGKTPEEVSAALGEAFKLEGDRLKFFQAAVDLVKTRVESLKRVVVMTAGEGEKAPGGTEEREGTHYLVEFYPAPESKQPRGGREDGKGRGGRGGKGGGRGKGGPGGRDGKSGGGRGGRDGARAPRDGASAKP